MLEYFELKKIYNDGFVVSPDGGCLISDENFNLGVDELFKYELIAIKN